MVRIIRDAPIFHRRNHRSVFDCSVPFVMPSISTLTSFGGMSLMGMNNVPNVLLSFLSDCLQTRMGLWRVLRSILLAMLRGQHKMYNIGNFMCPLYECRHIEEIGEKTQRASRGPGCNTHCPISFLLNGSPPTGASRFDKAMAYVRRVSSATYCTESFSTL